MGKNRRTCCHSRYRVRLALLARHITRMDCSGHRVFQRSTQVPLPDSLFSCGTRHHPVYPGFYGLLKPDGMGYIQTLPLQGKRAVRSRAALFMSATIQKTRRTGMEDTDIDTPMNYRAKLAYASCRTARSGRKRFRKKSSSPGGLRYFSRKPCLSGSIRRRALVVQRAAKARVFTIKTIRIMRQAIITRQPSQAPMRMPVARKPRVQVPEPAMKFPPRGSGPVHISALLNPILEISRHPDRNRLLAEFFKDA